ncbi:MAG: carboxypeptidase regulatory-like domain-containing protein [Gemmatimonadaceae bacterium]|nr:carboxypeptidase regulatory-like domain-containing protein [Gemmatimonadaceae bacterium]
MRTRSPRARHLPFALWLTAIAALAAPAVPWAPPLLAQVVRGTVTQSTSRAPVVGALVELVRADTAVTRVASALSDASGSYALRAPGAGRYQLVAKRIGVHRFASPPFELATGETRTLDVSLEPLEYRLPTVVVTANSVCSVNPGERDRVAALWDEARTALDAAEISQRDRLFTAQVTRYVRELEPGTLKVLRETRSEVRGVVALPFSSLPAESLAVTGYWRDVDSTRTRYYGPDARILLSDAFLDTHCFRQVRGHNGRRDQVGLAFAPTRRSAVPDVVGTLWLDARSFELRAVEFAYDRVRAGVDSARIGGELQFARLANGAWLVRRWFIRVPMNGRSQDAVATEGSSPWVLVRPSSLALSEEGGVVTTDEQRPALRLATLAGTVRDSGGQRPLPGAIVRVAGSAREVTPDADGRFVLDALPPSQFTVTVRAPGYDALGIAAIEQTVAVGEGEVRRITFTAPSARGIASRLCGGREVPFGRGTVHLTVRDSASGAPLAGVAATARWMSTLARAAGDSTPAIVERRSDAGGMLTLCELPADRPITIQLASPAHAPVAPLHLTIAGRELRRLEVRLARPNE